MDSTVYSRGSKTPTLLNTKPPPPKKDRKTDRIGMK